MAFSQFSCSFQSRTETVCSYNRVDKSRSLEIISLCNCKNVTDHCFYWSFSGVNTERELILARVGVFSEKETSAQKLDTICPYHRRELGIAWRRNSTKCWFQPPSDCQTSWPSDLPDWFFWVTGKERCVRSRPIAGCIENDDLENNDLENGDLENNDLENDNLEKRRPRKQKKIGKKTWAEDFYKGKGVHLKRSLVRGEPSKLVGPVLVRSFPYFFFPEECELLTIEARPSLSEASASFAPVRPRRTGGYSPVTEKKKQFRKWRLVERYPVFCYQFSIIYVPGRGMHQVFHAA